MQKISDFAVDLIEKAKAHGASAADVVVGESEDVSVTCRLGKLEDVERSVNSGFGLRVFVGQKSAVVSSSKFEGADELAERAVAMAKESPEDEFVGLADEELLARNVPNLDLYGGEEPSVDTLLEIALEAEDTARAQDGITNSEGGDASFSTYRNIIATSAGVVLSNESTHCGASVSVIAGEGSGMQTDYDYTSARFMTDLRDPKDIGLNAAKWAAKKVNPQKAKTGKYAVMFDPRVARGLVSDFASGINGSAIARGTSFLKNKMDEQVFADYINLVDDPHMQRGLASRPFDGEAVQTEKRKFVENGVLTSWILDTRSARKLGLQTTGHAARGASSPPSPSSSNFYMEAGEKSPAELMKEIGDGLYIRETFGMGVNYTTGDYSQGAAGYLIENGEIAGAVDEITLAGNLVDIFMNIIPANDLEFKYGTNSPTLLVKEMTVAGA